MQAPARTESQTQGAWHALAIEDLLGKLKVERDRGLTASEVEKRRAEYGPNTLEAQKSRSGWDVLFSQFKNVMVAVLLVAAAVSGAIGEWIDAIAILAILVLNVVLGFVQEFRAEKAHEALRKLSSPKAMVRREGNESEIDAADLVPGDVLILKEGDSPAADARLILSQSVRVQESALTGESAPIDKIIEPLEVGTQLADRSNMVYKGTAIVRGHGEGIVVSTGAQTELGRISGMLGKIVREHTPLQKRLDKLGKLLALAALAIVGLVFAIGLLRGIEARTLFMTSLSLAVAAVPEGLPGVVTIALALGSHRMLKRQALIRRLPAVETLGSVTVICSDKTGTLTQNKMTVARLRLMDQERAAEDDLESAFLPLLAAATLCSDAKFENGEASGDPMDVAILLFAEKHGLNKAKGETSLPRVAEGPFDPKRKRMSSAHRIEDPSGAWKSLAALAEDKSLLLVKGAYDTVVEVSSKMLVAGKAVELDKQKATACHDELAAAGTRVIAVATRTIPDLEENQKLDELEKDLTLIGMIGLEDPLRPEAAEAIKSCKEAGIRPIMITGDHALTASNIGKQVGIESDGTIEGREVESRSDGDLEQTVAHTSIFARATPGHKLKIIEALQRNGEIVAVTGDGVNDAPALKKSEIGVAMGKAGTEVAKDAADMVLLDDNFATIVAAVEEGRTVFDNIRKFVKYLLTTNSAELWVMLVAVALGMPLPLLPLQILWINLVTDGLPALALAMEPAEKHVMKRPPTPPQQGILAEGIGWHVLWVGMLMAGLSLYFAFSRESNDNWQTMLFTTLTLSQIAHVLAIRTFRDSFFKVGPWSNLYMLAAVAIGVGLQFAVVYWTPFQSIFGTYSLSSSEFALCGGLALVVFVAVEIEKLIRRKSVASIPSST